jgi:hypothetical protein
VVRVESTAATPTATCWLSGLHNPEEGAGIRIAGEGVDVGSSSPTPGSAAKNLEKPSENLEAANARAINPTPTTARTMYDR